MAPIGFSPPRRLALVLSLLAALACFGVAGASATTGDSVIFGAAFKDFNRDGAAQPDEPVLADQQLYLFDGGGNYLATTKSDAAGRYQFAGLAAGDYRVEYAAPSWWALRNEWVPTTTGSIYARVPVHLLGEARADFGWRTIVRSTDLSSPISTYVGSNGLRVESFDDVVPAKEIYDAVMRGTVGAEAPHVTIRFDYSQSSSTAAGWQGSPGSYSNYRAVCYDNYISWVDQGDVGVGHEYGHAWSLYYDTIVQQDGTLASYFKARGLDGDPRVNSTYAWSAREMIAEDYRQLLGSPTAQAATQMNRDIVPASEVPGLKGFLQDTFTQPSPPPPPTPPPPVAPLPPLTVSAPVVAPVPVTKSTSISSSISLAAEATITVENAQGKLVRTLLPRTSLPAGTVVVAWDRKDAAGRRVKAGTYIVSVVASDLEDRSASASTPFPVS